MDAFEEIVVGLLKHRKPHYWTWQSYKVNITKEEKRAIGKPSLPRPEIDVLAYHPATNELLWVECKSYLDSYGVRMDSFSPGDGEPSRFKIFTDRNYREVVSARLCQQVYDDGLTLANPQLKYCLVAGHIYSQSRDDLRRHFASNQWLLFDELWIQNGLAELAAMGYENDVAVIVAKLFAKAKGN